MHTQTARRPFPGPLRIAHVSDLHVTEGPRLDDQADVLRTILGQIREFRPHLVLLTGDLFGHAVPHRSTPRERAVLYPWVAALAQLCPVAVLYGNHDARPDLDVLALLGPVVRVLDGAGAVDVSIPGGSARIAWFAYPTTGWLLRDRPPVAAEQARQEAGNALAAWLRAQAAIVQAEPAKAHLLLGHVMVGGALTSGGEVLAGQEIEVAASDLRAVGADYVALGHLHRAQEVAPGAWYAGSPWRTDFGDVDPFKGWLAVTVDERGVDVELRESGSRRFATVDYRWRDGALALEEVSPPGAFGSPDPLETCRGMEVKLRLTAPAPEMATARSAFADVVAAARARAYRVTVETVSEPVMRVRAPELATAGTLEERLRVAWGQMEPSPAAEDQDHALRLLAQDLGAAP